MTGKWTGNAPAIRPSRILVSTGFKPAARTRSSTLSGATGGGSRSSSSSSRSRPPHSLTAIARMRGRPGRLPAVVGEGLVGLRHAEDVVLALVGAALLGLGVHQLVGKALRHRLLTALAGELDEPADGEGARAGARDLDRHLIGGATDAARADLELRGQGLDGLLEVLERLAARALADDRQRVVDDALGGRLLPVEHHLVDDLLDELGAVDRVRVDRADLGGCAARHYLALTPYCERAFLRSLTPAASSVPRTTL